MVDSNDVDVVDVYQKLAVISEAPIHIGDREPQLTSFLVLEKGLIFQKVFHLIPWKQFETYLSVSGGGMTSRPRFFLFRSFLRVSARHTGYTFLGVRWWDI